MRQGFADGTAIFVLNWTSVLGFHFLIGSQDQRVVHISYKDMLAIVFIPKISFMFYIIYYSI